VAEALRGDLVGTWFEPTGGDTIQPTGSPVA